MTMNKQRSFPLVAMTAAVLSAYSPAYAGQDDEVMALTKPASSVSVGIGYVSADAQRFGRHSGLNEEGAYSLLNADINKRDDSTGTWIKFKGNNLGLENRDMRFTHERQGDWAYYLDYSETPRFEPYTVNTALKDIGSPRITIPVPAAVEVPVHLKMKREALGLGYNKILGRGFDVTVRVRNEEKDGARIFSRGTSGAGFWEFTPEPLNSTTRQLDTILGYTTEKMYLAGSYYGTWYNNHNPGLRISGGNSNLSTFDVIGLPPDTQSHQLALSGNYNLTPTTKATFKAAYTKATQDDTFVSSVPLASGINAAGNLGGRVDTTQLQLGISARPTNKLSLLADARYEDRDDKTPQRLYTPPTGNATQIANATYTGYNEPRSVTTTTGKVEASYRLPLEMRVTGGVEYVEKERTSPSKVRVVAFRDKTEEVSYRIVLQRSMSESLTGSIGYIHSDRDGSNFQPNQLNGGTPVTTILAPLNLADRERDKLRLSLNWTPVEQLSIQFQTEQARDDYGHRTSQELGLRDGTSKNHSIDVSYVFSDEWQANAWISKNDTVANRAQRNGVASDSQRWASKLINDANSFGLGLRGKPYSRLEVGADLSHSEINDVHRQWAITGSAIPELADYYTRQSSVKLFGIYSLQKNASIRFDYVFDRYSSNDWTWSRWAYTDGTTLTQSPKQNANFFGITYIYRFY